MCQHNFCPNCAFPLTQTVQACPTCKAPTLDGWSFCGSCGGVLPKTPKLLPVRTTVAAEEEASKASPSATNLAESSTSHKPAERKQRSKKTAPTPSKETRLQLFFGEEYYGWVKSVSKSLGVKLSEAMEQILTDALSVEPFPAPIFTKGTHIKNKTYMLRPETVARLEQVIPKNVPKIAFVRGLLQREMQKSNSTPLPDDTTQVVATPDPPEATSPPIT